MPEILFEPSNHVYTVDGIQRPSATQILSTAGLIDTDWFTDEARERGRVVHKACHYLLENDLEDAWLETSSHAGYVRACSAFMREAGLQPQLVEHRVYNTQYGYCGTLDLTATRGTATVLTDWKTGAAAYWHQIQTVGYAACFEHPRKYHRMTVHLRQDGTYKVTEHRASDFAQDWITMQAALVIFQSKQRAGVGVDETRTKVREVMRAYPSANQSGSRIAEMQPSHVSGSEPERQQ